MRGVKNFCISKYEYSAFFCTKNHCHILKTRENSFQWNATILKQKNFENFKFSKINFQIFFLHFFLFLLISDFQKKVISWVFKLWQWFLVQMKAEILLYKTQKCFTPLFNDSWPPQIAKFRFALQIFILPKRG